MYTQTIPLTSLLKVKYLLYSNMHFDLNFSTTFAPHDHKKFSLFKQRGFAPLKCLNSPLITGTKTQPLIGTMANTTKYSRLPAMAHLLKINHIRNLLNRAKSTAPRKRGIVWSPFRKTNNDWILFKLERSFELWDLPPHGLRYSNLLSLLLITVI